MYWCNCIDSPKRFSTRGLTARSSHICPVQERLFTHRRTRMSILWCAILAFSCALSVLFSIVTQTLRLLFTIFKMRSIAELIPLWFSSHSFLFRVPFVYWHYRQRTFCTPKDQSSRLLVEGKMTTKMRFLGWKKRFPFEKKSANNTFNPLLSDTPAVRIKKTIVCHFFKGLCSAICLPVT